jgi:hypothetical protein
VVAGVIQNDQPVLSRRRTQAAPDGLHEQHPAFRRLGVDNAAHVEVDTDRQHADVADDARLAGPEAVEGGFAVLAVG